MLSFLNPSLLWALGLAGLPVLLHLIFLRTARRLPFSDLTLLRSVHARALPSTRLRQWLILALRCAALAFLVLAFARPVLHRDPGASGGSDGGLDVVLLADDSWSMGAAVRGKTRFESALASGVKLLRLLRPADRVAVAGFSDRLDTELAWAETPAAAEEAFSRLRVGARPSDIGPALAAAYAFLRKAGRESPAAGDSAGEGRRLRRSVIVLLSDGAQHLFSRLPAAGIRGLPGYDPEATLLGLSWPEGVENAAVAGLDSELGAGSGTEEGAMLAVRTALYPADAASSSGAGRPSLPLDLFLRDRRVDQRVFLPQPGQGPPLSFRLPPSREAEHWGRFQLRRDALEEDDSFHFALSVQPRPKLLLLYGNPSYMEAGRGGYFIRKMITNAEGRSLPYELDLADMGRLKEIRLEEYGAVLLADFRKLAPGMAETLTRYVARGGGLWVLAGVSAEPETYRELQRVLPGLLGRQQSYVGGSSSLLPRPEAIPAEANPERFSWEEFELSQVEIGRSYELEPAPKASVWFRDSTGRPLLVAGEFGRGRVLLWASALDIRWSNLALKPVFTAWLDVGLRHLTRFTGRHRWRTLKVGEPIVRVWEEGEPVPAKVQVRGPGSVRTVLLVRERKVEFRETRAPGIYFLQPLGGEEDAAGEAYAVNLDRAGPEGDLSPARNPPWKALGAETLAEDFLFSVYGEEVRGGALGLVLLLLLLELFLARPRASEAGARAPRGELAVQSPREESLSA